ncbi:MAG: lipopolysaccharide kinase InaA family protein [Bacteroidota bacterium]
MKYKVQDTHYNDLLKNIRAYFSESNNSIWDKRNKIKTIFFDEQEMTIKSFKIPHFMNKIAYTFLRDSKAKRSYSNSMEILEFVPKPIGYTEYENFGLLHDSYFVCERYAYDFTIREVLLQNNFEGREKIFKQFAAFTHALHMKGVKHLDYSPGNILIKKLDDNYEFKIIDVNRMQFKTLTAIERLENFSKLWAQDNDLSLIIDTYAKLIEMDVKEAFNIALKASQKHKDKKNLKKRLKGKKVVD